MGIFDRKKVLVEPPELNEVKEIKIQAVEGTKSTYDIESMLLTNSAVAAIPGITNSYTDYEIQTQAIYEKYNSEAAYGNQLVRTIVDYRTTFIGGEGVSVSSIDDKLVEWIENFLTVNHMNGSTLINIVKSSEMSGQALVTLEYDKEFGGVKIYRRTYDSKKSYRAKYKENTDKIITMQIKDKDSLATDTWKTLSLEDYVYVRTGGDDRLNKPPTTRVGVILTDIDNYDRALKDIRRNNHVFARITPVFEVNSESEANTLRTTLAAIKWKIGTAFIGKAKFSYATPTAGAHENLEAELKSVIKTISSITGVPVHWLGYVDLMANRATAESLYEMIKNTTLNERLILQEAIYDIIMKAQELYINNGGTDITLSKDFEVKLPLIDFANFLEKVRALKIAYDDQAISIEDYRNEIPGINPLKTAKMVEKEQAEAAKMFKSMGLDALGNNKNQTQTREEITDGKQSSSSKRLP